MAPEQTKETKVSRSLATLVATVLLVIEPSSARAQSERLQLVPNGIEFQVNTYTLGSQQLARVVADSTGGFLAVWESTGQDGSGNGVFAQRFDSLGARRGSEFQVSTFTVGDQSSPDAAVASENVIVVWQDLQLSAIRGRRLDAGGVPVGSEFQVSSTQIQDAGTASVAASSDTGFIVVWDGYNSKLRPAVLARRFGSDGQAVGAQFQVNPVDQLDPAAPDVAASGEEIVVAWDAPLDGSADTGVFARRYDSTADPIGSPFQVGVSTTEPPYEQSNPAVAIDSAERFVVAWNSLYRDGQDGGIFALRYDGAVPIGSEFQANTYTRGAQTYPTVASDGADGFIVLWTSSPRFEPLGQDGSARGIFGQQYDSLGQTIGQEFQVNAYTVGAQQAPALAPSAAGEFLVVWQSSDQDGDGEGIFAQRFGLPSPTATPTDTPTVTPTPTATPTPTVTPTGTPLPPCPGDCNLDRIVSVDELVLGVRIALAQARVSACRPIDPNRDFLVTIAELVTAVGSSIDGCPLK